MRWRERDSGKLTKEILLLRYAAVELKNAMKKKHKNKNILHNKPIEGQGLVGVRRDVCHCMLAVTPQALNSDSPHFIPSGALV